MATPAEMVVLIDAAIEALVSGKVQSASGGGQFFANYSLEQLRELRVTYAKMAAGETLAAGASRPIKVFGIRMGRPT